MTFIVGHGTPLRVIPPLAGFGFAPGNYWNHCRDCPPGTHFIGAKLCSRCERHAAEAKARWESDDAA